MEDGEILPKGHKSQFRTMHVVAKSQIVVLDPDVELFHLTS
jgi:hypothetical protein